MINADGIVQTHRELQRLAGDRGWLNGSRLVNRLADRLAMSHLQIGQNLLALAQVGVTDNIRPTGDGLGRVNILQRLPEEPTPISEHAQEWLILVWFLQKTLTWPCKRRWPIWGLVWRAFPAAIWSISWRVIRLLADRDELADRDPYELSAKYALGSLKVLGKLGRALSAAGYRPLCLAPGRDMCWRRGPLKANSVVSQFEIS
ncbi:hypothetical protein [Bradyrhizobium sp. CCBAU 51753]|uniref:hypothetical protein n=1 Tax=Bradyrhizobium sp. CCBAU 51753 TaxID=1325100 RepID=UPI00188CA811|nr:hypothetical protein [Bradyrhizobium sp. CCBAU 51753]